MQSNGRLPGQGYSKKAGSLPGKKKEKVIKSVILFAVKTELPKVAKFSMGCAATLIAAPKELTLR